MKGRDVFAVLPTGYGKSLCFGCPLLVFFELFGREEDSSTVVAVVYSQGAFELMEFIEGYVIYRVVITFQQNKTWHKLATRPSRLRARVWLRQTIFLYPTIPPT